MADQTITVTIPAGQTVVAALGIIMTHEGRVVIGDNTAPVIDTTTRPKHLLMMLEHARNEINKFPTGPLTAFRAANGLVRS